MSDFGLAYGDADKRSWLGVVQRDHRVACDLVRRGGIVQKNRLDILTTCRGIHLDQNVQCLDSKAAGTINIPSHHWLDLTFSSTRAVTTTLLLFCLAATIDVASLSCQWKAWPPAFP